MAVIPEVETSTPKQTIPSCPKVVIRFGVVRLTVAEPGVVENSEPSVVQDATPLNSMIAIPKAPPAPNAAEWPTTTFAVGVPPPEARIAQYAAVVLPLVTWFVPI